MSIRMRWFVVFDLELSTDSPYPNIQPDVFPGLRNGRYAYELSAWTYDEAKALAAVLFGDSVSSFWSVNSFRRLSRNEKPDVINRNGTVDVGTVVTGPGVRDPDWTVAEIVDEHWYRLDGVDELQPAYKLRPLTEEDLYYRQWF